MSDPGALLVSAAASAGVPIVAVPGPCAAIAALSIAALPTERFAFEGFLPAKASARRRRLAALAAETRTLVFYEAPHRLHESLDDLAAVFGGEPLQAYLIHRRQRVPGATALASVTLDKMLELLANLYTARANSATTATPADTRASHIALNSTNSAASTATVASIFLFILISLGSSESTGWFKQEHKTYDRAGQQSYEHRNGRPLPLFGKISRADDLAINNHSQPNQ